MDKGIAETPAVYKLRLAHMQTLLRLVIVGVLVAIVASLGSALWHLSRGTGAASDKLARSLTIRIALSIALFILLMLAWYFGLITPHGVGPAPR
jgi:uncharacterized membrane protein